MININKNLLKQLIVLKDRTLAFVMAFKGNIYDSIKNYINLLEYCIINLNPETYYTIIMTVEFVVDKYSVPIFYYETLAEEIQCKRDEEESKLYPEDLTGIQLTLYGRTTNENQQH